MRENTKCIRCGKKRVISREWTETVNGSKIFYTETACPDKECQQVVEETLKKKMDKLNALKNKSPRNRAIMKKKEEAQKKEALQT